MRMRLLGLLLAALAAAPAWAADISRAERLVFQDDHLGRLHPPTMLRYTFIESGPGAAVSGGQLQLVFTARADGGCCAVVAEEKGGSAFAVLPPVEDARSNPVILYFLERDVQRMQVLTGGQSNYFRRLIRLALANHAAVLDTTVRYAGRDLAAHEIRVTPYVDDPGKSRYAALADKAYVFLLAAEVPGGVYQIRAAVSPSAETVLTLAEATVAAADAPSVQERTP